MAAGIGLLRLPPPTFWAMTPRELTAALHGLVGLSCSTPPLNRDGLHALMARFPDA